MNIIEPENIEKEEELLQTGDILIDCGEVYVLIYNHNIQKFMFHSLSKSGGGYNGLYDTIEGLTKSTLKILKDSDCEARLYRSSEYDLHIVPKQR